MRVIGAVAVLVVGLAPVAAERARAERVVIVSYPRLSWATVVAVQPPELVAFAETAAVASLAVRTASAETGLGDGYATISAGNRVSADDVPQPMDAQPMDAQAGKHPGFAVLEDEADDALFGAEPGALAQALTDSGRTMAVIGNADIDTRAGDVEPHREVALAGVDRSGRLPAGRIDRGLAVSDPAAPGGRVMDVAAYTDALDEAWDEADVIVVEVSDLERADLVGADPAGALLRGDAILGAVRQRAGPGDLVMVVAPASAGDAHALTTFAAAGADLPAGGRATSATTRRAGYVTLPDVGVTVLDALDVAVPDAMNGTAVTAGGGARNGLDALRALAGDDERARFRDRAVGPVSVVFTVAQVLTYTGALVVVRRNRRVGAAGTSARQASTLRQVPAGGAGRAENPGEGQPHQLPPAFGVIVLALLSVPLVGFVSGLVRYRALGLWGYTLAVPVVALAIALAVGPLRGLHRLAPALAVAGATLALLVIDVATGAHLQLDTVFGYSPTVAGRFSGFGNLAYALVGASAIVVATGQAAALSPAGTPADAPLRDRRLGLAAAVLAATVLAVGLPSLGADVGGTLALVPAAIAVVVLLGRWRVDAARIALAGLVTVAVVAAFAVVDLARPADERTHLGRFAAGLVDGDAGLVVRRKLATNWAILSSSVWNALVPLIVIGVALLARPGRPLHGLARRVVGVEALLAGAGVMAVLGFAFNDSGVAIPAMTLSIVLPWLVWLLTVPASSCGGDVP